MGQVWVTDKQRQSMEVRYWLQSAAGIKTRDVNPTFALELLISVSGRRRATAICEQQALLDTSLLLRLLIFSHCIWSVCFCFFPLHASALELIATFLPRSCN